MLRTHRQKLEAATRAHVMLHKTWNVRVCYWRRLREVALPNLPHSKRVWKLVTRAPSWR